MDLITTFFNADVMRRAWPFLVEGAWLTLQLGILSILLSLLGGLLLVLLRLYSPRPSRFVAKLYIVLFRAVPVLVLLVIIYYALPFVGLRLSSFGSATLALSLVASAYVSEILRSGIAALPKGQFEASDALGLSFWHQMADVVLPQAFRIVVPSLTNNCINVIKDTALASVVTLPDLLKQATEAQAVFASPTPLIGAAAIYLVILIPMVALVGTFEGKSNHGRA